MLPRSLCLAMLLFSTSALRAETAGAKWWQALPSDRPQAWVDEAQRLIRQGATVEALAIMEQAGKHFPQDPKIAEELSRFMTSTANAGEDWQRYRAQFEQARSLEERLNRAGVLGWWAREKVFQLPALLAELEKRQRQDPGNAVPWLILAAVHRGAGNEVKQDECVRAAAGTGSQDVPVLLQIARFQEEAALSDAQHRTLLAATRIDGSGRAQGWLACLELAYGDAARGLRMYDELKPRAPWSADDALVLAEALLRVAEWPRVLALIQPAADRQPEDCRLGCMLATAQEEEGRVEEAAASWVKVLAATKDRAKVPLSSWPAYSERASMPQGTEVWTGFAKAMSDAYDHRFRSRRRAEGMRERMSEEVTPLQAIKDAPLQAFAHLWFLAAELAPAKRVALVQDLRKLGYQDAENLLTAPLDDNSPRMDGTLLKLHPRDAALHAAWYLDKDWLQWGAGSRLARDLPDSSLTPERLEHSFDLFAKDYPELALRVAGKSFSAATVLKRLPEVIERLGFPSLNTLRDLNVISAQAVEHHAPPVSAAVSARLERWLREDRVPVSARDLMVTLITQHQTGSPSLRELFAQVKHDKEWSDTAKVPFVSYTTAPPDKREGRQMDVVKRASKKAAQAGVLNHPQRAIAEALAEKVQQHLREKHRDLALQDLHAYLEIAADDWLDYSLNDASYLRLDQLRYKGLELDSTLLPEAVQAFASNPNPARYGALLEMSGSIDAAALAYERAYQSGERRLHLLRRLAVMDARTNVQAGLKRLQTISAMHLPNCIDCLAADSGRGNGGYNSADIRLANGRLLTAWLEQRAADHKPLLHTLRLGSAALVLGHGNDHFRDLWGYEDKSPQPYPAEFHELFEAMCAAFMKFPETALTGLAARAAVAKNEGRPLEPFYQQALHLLSDRRITNLDIPDSLRLNQRFPGDQKVPLLHPGVLATEYAVLCKPPGTFEKEVLPVILQGWGTVQEPVLRAYAALCAAGNEDFISRAETWLGMEGPQNWRRDLFPDNRAGQRGAMVKRLWKEKQLTVPLDDLLAKQPK